MVPNQHVAHGPLDPVRHQWEKCRCVGVEGAKNCIARYRGEGVGNVDAIHHQARTQGRCHLKVAVQGTHAIRRQAELLRPRGLPPIRGELHRQSATD